MSDHHESSAAPEPVPSPPGLKGRVISTGLWTLAGHGTSQVLRFAGNLIMTRLLIPEAFGLMAMANVILFGLALFTDLGLRQNIVQSRRGDDPDFLNAVWTIQVLRGALLWLMASLAAVIVFTLSSYHVFLSSSTYADPQLPWLIVVISFSSVIGGFESTNSSSASRSLKVGRITLLALATQVVSLTAMLLLGWTFRSVWALVIANLISSTFSTLASHYFLPGQKNRFHWDTPVAWEIIHFGKWVFVSSVLGFLASNGDRLLLGGLIDARSMGLYATAYLMVSAFLDIFNKVAGSTVFPALSEAIRTRPDQLKSMYYRFRRPVDIGTLAMAGLLMVSGQQIVDILYDGRYHEAGLMLQLLSVLFLESRYALSGQAYMALGRPKYLSFVILVRTIALFVLLLPAFYWGGLDWAVLAAGGSVLFTIPATLYFQHKLGFLDWKRELLFLPVFPLALALGFGFNAVVRLISG